MSVKSKLKQSRNHWKRKARERSDRERYLRRENNRIKKERDRYKNELREAEKRLEKESCKKISPAAYGKEELVYVALQLFLIARISFRAVARVLEVIGGYLGLIKTPCPQTIINWVIRLSIARIQNIGRLGHSYTAGPPCSSGFICIIDISIGLGSGKILTALFLDARHHMLNDGAPALRHTNCVAVATADSWTGEKIADFLQKVIAVTGRPAAYLKDGGTDLAKAVRLLGEQGVGSPSIDDISHTVANLLKHEYQNHPMFTVFISACGKASKNLKQTVLACLAPPKVSTRARFMNLHRLVQWAAKLLGHSPPGRAPKGSVLSKLRAAFDRIPECKAFINRFLRDANSLLACQEVLKTKGLSQDTYEECLPLLEAIPPRSSVRIGFIAWMDEQLSVAAELGLDKAGMPISSDNIESLFGVAKRHGTGEIKDADRIALRIPAICGEVTRQDARDVLNISVKEQQEVLGSMPSLIKQRRQVLPNPGCLDKLQSDGEQQNLELIPRPEKRSKNVIIESISCGYSKIADPLADSQKPPDHFPEMEIIGVPA